jgi:shikimate kinase
MMGSGKSTLAPLLADAWSAQWVDLDRRIERIFGQTIPALFAAGEPIFRRCEAAALRSLVAEPGVRARTLIVATGGGTVVDPSSRALMAEVGAIIHLHVDVEELVARLYVATDDRPLLSEAPEELRQRLERLLEARHGAYACAEVVVDGSGSPQDVLRRVVAAPLCSRGEAP